MPKAEDSGRAHSGAESWTAHVDERGRLVPVRADAPAVEMPATPAVSAPDEGVPAGDAAGEPMRFESPSEAEQADGHGKESRPRMVRGRKRAAAGVLCALACAVAVFSLGYVVPSEDGSWSVAWLMGADASQGGDASADDAAGSDEASDTDEASSAQETGADAASDDDDGTSGPGTSAVPSSDDSSASDGGSGAGVSSGNTASSQGSGETSDSGSVAPPAADDDAAAPAPQTITVSVSVSSDAADGSVSMSGRVSLPAGATAYDALCGLGCSVDATASAFGTYVRAIGGLAEKQFGASSGWMYAVNGRVPNVSCSGYGLSDGDSVSWYYTVG